jgi:hypothetical protein
VPRSSRSSYRDERVGSTLDPLIKNGCPICASFSCRKDRRPRPPSERIASNWPHRRWLQKNTLRQSTIIQCTMTRDSGFSVPCSLFPVPCSLFCVPPPPPLHTPVGYQGRVHIGHSSIGVPQIDTVRRGGKTGRDRRRRTLHDWRPAKPRPANRAQD